MEAPTHPVRPKALDLAAILLGAALVALSAATLRSAGPGAMVRIEAAGRSWVYPLSEDRSVRVTGPLGESVVEIKDGAVRMASSPCPGQQCVHQKAVHAPSSFIACLPNEVLVTITAAQEEADAVTD